MSSSSSITANTSDHNLSLCNIRMVVKNNIDITTEFLKSELSKEAPDYTVIEQLGKELSILNKLLDSPAALIEGESKDALGEDSENIKYNKDDFAKIRYYWKRGMKYALGNIVLNPNRKKILNSDGIIDFVCCFDVSYSMGDAPLEEFSKLINKNFNNLLQSGINIRLNCIVYGNYHEVFIRDMFLTRDNLGEICALVDKHVGRKNNQDNNIRTDTIFKGPIKEMLNILKEKETGFGLLFSDGKENRTNTDVIALMKKCFDIGCDDNINGLSKYKFELCMATYGKNCGEGTKMQQLANFWNTHSGGNGNFACADNIFGLYKFVEDACCNMFYKSMAENIHGGP